MSDDLIEKLARIPQFYMPSLNHSKDELAFYWDITGRIELYVMNLSSGDYKQISNGEVQEHLDLVICGLEIIMVLSSLRIKMVMRNTIFIFLI